MGSGEGTARSGSGALAGTPEMRAVMSPDGLRIATYDAGDADSDAPVVLAVHGFASAGPLNWVATGWVRDLTKAGLRVILLDQRGHGASDKPRDPGAYTMDALVADAMTVLDAYLVDEALWLGYSLGARVGWAAAAEWPERIRAAVLGGIPDGDPLTRFRIDQAMAFVDSGAAIDDALTRTYLEMASGIRGNDLAALVALVEGMRGGPQPSADNAPRQPLLLATGGDDPILQKSRGLAEAAPDARFLEVPGRTHFNAPTSRVFRDAGVAFLAQQAGLEADASG